MNGIIPYFMYYIGFVFIILCQISFAVVRYQADICLTSHGSEREITDCGVFVKDAYWLCPFGNNTFSTSTCTKVCTCQPGTGKTPSTVGPSYGQCDGIDRACDSSDVSHFCGAGDTSCTKRCQFTTADPHIMGGCVVLNGTCAATQNVTKTCSGTQLTACGPTAIGCTQTFFNGKAVDDPRCICNSSDSASSFHSYLYQCDQWESYMSMPSSYCVGNCSDGWLRNNTEGCRARKWFAPWSLHDKTTQEAVLFLSVINALTFNSATFQYSNNLPVIRNPSTQSSTFNYTFYTLRCDCDGTIMRDPNLLISVSSWGVGPGYDILNPLSSITDSHSIFASSFTFPANRVPYQQWLSNSKDFSVYVGVVTAIDEFWQVQNCKGPFIRATPWTLTTENSVAPTTDRDRKAIAVFLDPPRTLLSQFPSASLDNFDASLVKSRSKDLYYYDVSNVPRGGIDGRLCSGVGIPRLIYGGVFNQNDGSTIAPAQTARAFFLEKMQAWRDSPYAFWKAHFATTTDDAAILVAQNYKGYTTCQQIADDFVDIAWHIDLSFCERILTDFTQQKRQVTPGDVELLRQIKAYYANLLAAQVAIEVFGEEDAPCGDVFNIAPQYPADGAEVAVCNGIVPYFRDLDIAYGRWVTETQWFLSHGGNVLTNPAGKAYDDQIVGNTFTPKWASRIPFAKFSGCDCISGYSFLGTTDACTTNACCAQTFYNPVPTDCCPTENTVCNPTCHTETTQCGPRVPSGFNECFYCDEQFQTNNLLSKPQTLSVPCQWMFGFALQVQKQQNSPLFVECPLLPGTNDIVNRFLDTCTFQGLGSCPISLQLSVANAYCHWGKPISAPQLSTGGGVIHYFGASIECVCDPGVQKNDDGRCVITCGGGETFGNSKCLGPIGQQCQPANCDNTQPYTKCSGHGYMNSTGCICDSGFGGYCCEKDITCQNNVNGGLCNPLTVRADSCDSTTNPNNPKWICSTTPEGNFTGPCCDVFIWSSTRLSVCSFSGGIATESSISTTDYLGATPFSNTKVHCQCPVTLTGSLCQYSVCPSTSNGTCDGHGVCEPRDPEVSVSSSNPVECRQSVEGTAYKCRAIGSENTYSGFDGCACNVNTENTCRDSGDAVCSGQGSCIPTHAVNLTYACSCNAVTNGTFCENSDCGFDVCNQGKCVTTGSACSPNTCNTNGCVESSTSVPHCQCANCVTCDGITPCNLKIGSDCSLDVTSLCGHQAFDDFDMKLCNLHGSCVRTDPAGPYGCVCTGGWSGDKCQVQPCTPNPCTGHAYCDTDDTQCKCWKHWSPTGSCNVNDCTAGGVAAHPSSDSLTSICVCDNSTRTFESGCAHSFCPLDSTGTSCGSVELSGTVCAKNTVCADPVLGSNGCNCCIDGRCICDLKFQLNSTTGLCDSRCNPLHTTDVITSFPAKPIVFSHCVCFNGYDETVTYSRDTNGNINGIVKAGCTDTICGNRGTLNAGGLSCTCNAGYSGTTCTGNVCQNNGIFNSTSSKCKCDFPFTGDTCESHACLNGGTPELVSLKCVCPFAYSGTLCQTDLCVPPGQNATLHGTPSSDGTRCICNSIYYSGPYCNTLQCQHSGTFTSGCNCLDDFKGALCTQSACGLFGHYLRSESRCNCTSPVIITSEFTGECVDSICGPFGSLSDDLQSCVCDPGVNLQTGLASNVSILCIPNCQNGGFYNDSGIPGIFNPCQCTNSAFGDLCEFLPASSTAPSAASSSSTAPSSTAVVETVESAAASKSFFATPLGIGVVSGGSVVVAAVVLVAVGVNLGWFTAAKTGATIASATIPITTAQTGNFDFSSSSSSFSSDREPLLVNEDMITFNPSSSY